MDPAETQAIVSYMGDISNSAIQSITSKKQMERTIQANRELADYSYSQQQKNWHQQNLYNSPTQQMARFKEAGLNPNLIYGKGTPGNATETPKYQAPREDYDYTPMQVPNMINTYQDVRLKEAQTDNLHAQEKAVTQSTENDRVRQLLLLLDKDMGQSKLNVQLGSESHQLSAKQATAKIAESTYENLVQDLTNKKTINIKATAEAAFQQHRAKLASYGVYSSDNVYLRWLVMNDQFEEAVKSMESWWQKFQKFSDENNQNAPNKNSDLRFNPRNPQNKSR
nr:MAG: DNA pilot protein [Microvirus sp.]